MKTFGLGNSLEERWAPSAAFKIRALERSFHLLCSKTTTSLEVSTILIGEGLNHSATVFESVMAVIGLLLLQMGTALLCLDW